MDSDGCVMDTVRIKHSTVMCPELIRVFALDDYAEFITAAWDEINLHTITRASPGLRACGWCFDRLKNRGIEIPGSEDIAAWVDTANELSTASLQRGCKRQAAWPCANCRSGTMPATAASRPWSRRLSRSPV